MAEQPGNARKRQGSPNNVGRLLIPGLSIGHIQLTSRTARRPEMYWERGRRGVSRPCILAKYSPFAESGNAILENDGPQVTGIRPVRFDGRTI